MKFCHLLTLKSFQTFMAYFLLWNMKADFFEEYREENWYGSIDVHCMDINCIVLYLYYWFTQWLS